MWAAPKGSSRLRLSGGVLLKSFRWTSIPSASSDSVCAEALGSKVTNPQVLSIYTLDPAVFGTFDLVMFFGLLYHLEHPLLGVEKVAAMTSGTLLVQSYTLETAALADQSIARFQPHGIESGPKDNPIFDPTVFWDPMRPVSGTCSTTWAWSTSSAFLGSNCHFVNESPDRSVAAPEHGTARLSSEPKQRNRAPVKLPEVWSRGLNKLSPSTRRSGAPIGSTHHVTGIPTHPAGRRDSHHIHRHRTQYRHGLPEFFHGSLRPQIERMN